MARFSDRIKLITEDILRKTGSPESVLPEKRKKVGRGMILLGAALIVPLVVMDTVPPAVNIVVQLCYATLICLGAILAIEEKKNR